jgi:hypothetical protein
VVPTITAMGPFVSTAGNVMALQRASTLEDAAKHVWSLNIIIAGVMVLGSIMGAANIVNRICELYKRVLYAANTFDQVLILKHIVLRI